MLGRTPSTLCPESAATAAWPSAASAVPERMAPAPALSASAAIATPSLSLSPSATV